MLNLRYLRAISEQFVSLGTLTKALLKVHLPKLLRGRLDELEKEERIVFEVIKYFVKDSIPVRGI